MESGKRKYSRSEFSQIITYSLLPSIDDTFTTGLLYDFSYAGLCIITKHPFQEGQEILLKTGVTRTSITAVVRWCSDMGNSTYKVGLEIKH
jgi:predicted hydrolase (HD superfamily)